MLAWVRVIFLACGETWLGDPEQWWREIEVNLRGPYLCARAVLSGMVARRQGRIINVGSIAGLWPLPYVSAYGTSKAAVIRFSECLAAETKEYGISVFAIHPGTVRTPMNTYWLDFDGTSLSAPAARSLEGFCGVFEQGHDASMERPVALVLLLASGKADALSGCFISIDDDVAEMVSQAAEIQRDGLHTLRLHP